MLKRGPEFFGGGDREVETRAFFFATWLAVGRWLYDNILTRLNFIPSKKKISFSFNFFTQLVGAPRRFATLLNPGFGSSRPYEVEVNLGRTFFLHVRVISFISIVGWVGKIGALTLLSSFKKRSTTTFRNLEWCTNERKTTRLHMGCVIQEPTEQQLQQKKEREIRVDHFTNPILWTSFPSASPGSHGGVLRSQQQCFGKGETDGSWPSKWPSSFRGGWDPAIVWASVWDVFFFKTCLVKRMKAPHRKKRFIEVFWCFFWEVEDWETSARCWLCNPIWYFVAASCLLARRTLCAVC